MAAAAVAVAAGAAVVVVVVAVVAVAVAVVVVFPARSWALLKKICQPLQAVAVLHGLAVAGAVGHPKGLLDELQGCTTTSAVPRGSSSNPHPASRCGSRNALCW